MRRPALITVAEAAKVARISPRQMRRRLQAKDPDGKILVRESAAKRSRFRVNVKELARSDCDWLAEIDDTLTERRLRQLVSQEVTWVTDALGRELRSLARAKGQEGQSRTSGIY
jgi:hypothetical protein